MSAAADNPHAELIELLLELQHDLGKYIRLPLAMLPANASNAEVREALEMGLIYTRQGPGGTRSAETIWRDFLDEAQERLRGFQAFPALCDTVEHALAWRSSLTPTAPPIERDALDSDLQRVSEAIRNVIVEIERWA